VSWHANLSPDPDCPHCRGTGRRIDHASPATDEPATVACHCFPRRPPAECGGCAGLTKRVERLESLMGLR
jgi:hypothetical protein